VYTVNNGNGPEPLYLGVWRPGLGGQYLYVGLPYDDFYTRWQDLFSQGFRMRDFVVHPR
jgi:hypothetical protein